ncbi:hypothetical protein JNUCC1_02793 [Lentibacillus sp. JNUCC-1]|uniref:hypothetical protein n=1 Tax=Lentibacillus sp. JNUCC-1 TaxID=2654513 RepID=UPI0012E7962E|nr:hypothetical protein [Lentibacillus sp. JNUCC-1]MUV38921.1 hypothetical protein [Lentibacillus sp. JNUCC-1]
MKLDFVKISPSQNMTALITSEVHPSDYATVGNMIMDYEYIHAEQAGFITKPTDDGSILRLEMSGGEFCGNAVLAAGAYCIYKGLSKEEHFKIEASGALFPLACHAKVKAPGLFEAEAEMPQPLSMDDTTFHIGAKSISGALIRLGGITHFVTDFWPNNDDFPSILETIKETVHDKAIGIIPYRHVNDEAYEIRPFIYVTERGVHFSSVLAVREHWRLEFI